MSSSATHGARDTSPHDLPGTGPLWARVEADLRLRIAREEFVDGFPGEIALAEEYGVSRHTARESLRRLREEGLVRASRGRASTVTATAIEQPVGALYSLFAAAEAAGLRQDSVVRALEVTPDAAAAAVLGLEPGTELLHLERLRLADGLPLALDEVWLPAQGTRPLLEADFRHTALYEELATRCGIRLTGGREQIRAVVPDPAATELLGVDPGTAAFAVERVGTVGTTPFEWRRTLVRGDRFTLTAEFTARGGYRLSGRSS